MTDDAPESHEMITRDEGGRPTALATLPPGTTAQFLPKSVSELAQVAQFAAGVGLFGVTKQGIAFNIMLAGAHLGLTPYASLEGITLINGRPVVSAQVQWTLILSRGQVEDYDIDSSDKHCEITVRSRKWREAKSQRVTMDDVPSTLRDKQTYKQHASDMLFAFCVRRLRKRYFPEVMVGALDSQDTDAIGGTATVVESTAVVDVGAVEEHLGGEVETPPCPKVMMYGNGTERPCGNPTELVPGRSGGMFLRCTEGHMMPPPQAVRDAIRGHREGMAAIQQAQVADESAAATDWRTYPTPEGGDASQRHDTPIRETTPPPVESGAGASLADTEPPPSEQNQGAEVPTAGAALPPNTAQDVAFVEAAGIAQGAQPEYTYGSAETAQAMSEAVAPEAVAHEPPVMSRKEADEAMQAIMAHLTAVKADKAHPERLAAAKTVIESHGYPGDGLTSWMMKSFHELPGLLRDLNIEQGALPL